jgi:hypothetical protein
MTAAGGELGRSVEVGRTSLLAEVEERSPEVVDAVRSFTESAGLRPRKRSTRRSRS